MKVGNVAGVVARSEVGEGVELLAAVEVGYG